jgi:putative transposase
MLVDWPNSIITGGCSDQIQSVQMATLSTRDHPPLHALVVEPLRDCRIDRSAARTFIVLSEEHLRRILKTYFLYYHNSRPHQALDQNAPIPRTVESGKKGPVITIPEVGGLHHRYQRAA